MTTYFLEIQFTSKGLATVNAAGQQVAIVKSTTPTSSPVVWVAFHPEMNNHVTWTEEYSVYGSNSEIVAGATISTASSFEALASESYPFVGGQFEAGVAGLEPTQYGVLNQDVNFPMLTAGLAQVPNGSGSSAGPSPLNATLVPFGESGIYTPIEQVSVFALANANNGLVISSVQSQALLVDLTETTSQTIHYDDQLNVFAPGPLAPIASARRRLRRAS